jgi:predicted HicB family RNase H-like nuclease
MNNMLFYKGYFGSVEYSAEDDLLCGKAVGIRDLIMYHGESIKELRADFQDAIDHYLSVCEEEGWEPNPPFYAPSAFESVESLSLAA